VPKSDEVLTPEEIASLSDTQKLDRIALKLHYISTDQQRQEVKLDNLVTKDVCEARTQQAAQSVKHLTKQLEQAGNTLSDVLNGKVGARVAEEVDRQVPPLLAREVPPAVKLAVKEVTGIHRLTKALEQAERRKTGTEHQAVGAISGLQLVKKHSKLFAAIATALLAALGTCGVKAAYMVVEIDQSMKDTAGAQEKNEKVLQQVKSKVEEPPEAKVRYIKVLVPVYPDAGVTRRRRPLRFRRRRAPRRGRPAPRAVAPRSGGRTGPTDAGPP
jgi:hypothetical protein